MSSEFTFLIKTILRPDALRACLKSLRRFFPDTPVWIADDSPEPYPQVAAPYGNIHYETYPFDIGIGTCYNEAIDSIGTMAVVLLDDDFNFTDRTTVGDFMPFLRHRVVDLVGGSVWAPPRNDFQGFSGFFTPSNSYGQELSHGTINLRKIPRQECLGRIRRIECTMNFWAATTESLRATRWDPDLKVCRHEDFFLRYVGYRPRDSRISGFRASYFPRVVVTHVNNWSHLPEYRALRRDRFPDFRKVFIDKWGFEFV